MNALRTCRGYIPDPPGHMRTPFRHLAARLAVTVIALAADLRPHAPAVLDQGDTGSCTGESTGPACTCALAIAGSPLPWVASPDGIYRDARCIDRADPSVALTDDGAMPNQVMRAINEWGLREMKAPTSDGRYSDCEPATVNREPTLADLEAESKHVVLGQYAIYSADDLALALTNGIPVTASISAANDSFQLWTPDNGPLGAQSPVQLDHYIWFIAFRTDAATGKRIFRIRNSWGASWGDYGEIEVTEAFVAQCGDMYALSIQPLKVAS